MLSMKYFIVNYARIHFYKIHKSTRCNSSIEWSQSSCIYCHPEYLHLISSYDRWMKSTMWLEKNLQHFFHCNEMGSIPKILKMSSQERIIFVQNYEDKNSRLGVCLHGNTYCLISPVTLQISSTRQYRVYVI